jgi:hypothetical protein
MKMEASVINQKETDHYGIYNGDCCEVLKGFDDDSIHYSVFSPPFASLYTYSDSERDMGNCESDAEFFQHFGFLVPELYRVIMPGRLVSIHCMNLPSTKSHQGYIGIRDFRGDVIRSMESKGFIYHSEVCIWKDPVVAMQRTKALGLLHKQVCKDSTRSRMGIPDYVCTFRKPGDNPEPVEGQFERFIGDEDSFENTGNYSIDVWQRYASPVWADINQTNTLNGRLARAKEDERHICPLQLDVIARCLQLWTNPGDIVLSPFAGIGSEGYQSILMGRKFIGVELKESYFQWAIKYLDHAVNEASVELLF